ncbi:MAG: hypothetical protein AB1705_09010 [Verrucomicrobiota bacterium]
MFLRFFIRLLCVAFALGVAGLASAQLPVTRLSSVFPPGGKAGGAVEVTLHGSDLDELTAIHFTHPGISAKAKPGEANRFIVTIADSVPAGVYEARVVGHFGISNPRAFVVGDRPEVLQKKPNQALAAAMDIAPGTVVNGFAEGNQADYYKFTAKQGERVLITCAAEEIDSRMDAALVLQDAAGRELQRARSGGLLDFTAPADSAYVVKVHDFLFRGNTDYFYRLTIGAGPHIDFVLPPAGAPGKGKYTLFGRNLPGGTAANVVAADGKPLERLDVEIELPGDAPAQQRLAFAPGVRAFAASLDGLEYRLKSAKGVSNPVLIGYATAPVVLEQPGNDKPEQAQKVTAPCEYAGQFFPRGDEDWVTFEAKKGEVFWIEAICHRLGIASKPFLVIQRVTKDDKGQINVAETREVYDAEENLGGVEFNTIERDPAHRLEVKDDGAYRVRVTDLFNETRNDPARVYRLSLRKETPDFRLVAMVQPPRQVRDDAREAIPLSLFLRRGETAAVKVMAFRKDNFGGDIDLAVEGLPAGVSAASCRVEAGRNIGTVLLTAAEDAANWAGTIRITGRAKMGEQEVVREARGGSVVWHVGDFNEQRVDSRVVREVALAVSAEEAAPLSLGPAENKTWEVGVGGKLEIPVRVTRRAEFGEALKLKAVGIGVLDPLKEIDIDGKATNATVTIDLNQQKIPPGTHTFRLEARTKGKFRPYAEAAKVVEDAAKAAEKTATDLAAEAKKAAEALAAAVKAFQEAEAKVKSVTDGEKAAAKARLKETADAKAAAEKASNEAAAKAKDAETKKTEAQNRAKPLTEKSKPREAIVTVYSAPFVVKVNPAPAK